MSQIHAIVWLDHLNATVIGLSLGKSELVAYTRGRTSSASTSSATAEAGRDADEPVSTDHRAERQ